MKTAFQTLAIAFASVTAAAALGVTLADHTAARSTPPRAQSQPLMPPAAASEAPVAVVARLPRVVVEQHRIDAPAVAVAHNRHASAATL